MPPDWFLDTFPGEDGPYTWHVDDEPVRKRDGVTIRSHTSFPRSTLPCCTRCNAELDRRFEKQAKPVVRDVMASEGKVKLDKNASEAFAIWVLKTWLLLAHPALFEPEQSVTPPGWNLELTEADLYDWMVVEHPPPSGLSVWITREQTKQPTDEDDRAILLPTIVRGDQRTKFQCLQRSYGFLTATLVYHPGWEVEHPLEADRRAIRLWPSASTTLDLSSLRPSHGGALRWVEGPIVQLSPDAQAVKSLPPISSGTDFLTPPKGVVSVSW